MPIHSSASAGALWLTLDEPKARNALSPQLIEELSTAIRQAAEDASVRCIVLDHTGSTFCSGANLAAAKDVGVAEVAGAFMGLLRLLAEVPLPVVAVVDGHVRAGGVGLVASCDVVVASFGGDAATGETRLGLAPAMIAVPVQARATPRLASRYLLTGEVMDAHTAREGGLFTAVVDDPRAEARTIAAEFQRCSPQGLAETKTLLNAGLLADFDARGDQLQQLSVRLFRSEEAKEGMSAFLDKRAPRWAQ